MGTGRQEWRSAGRSRRDGSRIAAAQTGVRKILRAARAPFRQVVPLHMSARLAMLARTYRYVRCNSIVPSGQTKMTGISAQGVQNLFEEQKKYLNHFFDNLDHKLVRTFPGTFQQFVAPKRGRYRSSC
eukprot:scaffold175_cov414-Prasinococcus_capsulatus_cf.AAC.40